MANNNKEKNKNRLRHSWDLFWNSRDTCEITRVFYLDEKSNSISWENTSKPDHQWGVSRWSQKWDHTNSLELATILPNVQIAKGVCWNNGCLHTLHVMSLLSIKNNWNIKEISFDFFFFSFCIHSHFLELHFPTQEFLNFVDKVINLNAELENVDNVW